MYLPLPGMPVMTSVLPVSGSVNGGTTLTITGHGYVDGATTVTIGGATCTVSSTTVTQIICDTTAHAAGSLSVDVVVAGTTNINFPTTVMFDYDSAATPTISSITGGSTTADSGEGGDTITIDGTGFTGSK